MLWGQPYIEDFIGDVKYQISPQSFFQVNPMQTEKLYAKALEYAGLTGNETVWDLYCGIGTISLFLAKMRARYMAWKLCRRQLKMPAIMQSVTVSTTQSFSWARRKKSYRHFMKNPKAGAGFGSR